MNGFVFVEGISGVAKIVVVVDPDGIMWPATWQMQVCWWHEDRIISRTDTLRSVIDCLDHGLRCLDFTAWNRSPKIRWVVFWASCIILLLISGAAIFHRQPDVIIDLPICCSCCLWHGRTLCHRRFVLFLAVGAVEELWPWTCDDRLSCCCGWRDDRTRRRWHRQLLISCGLLRRICRPWIKDVGFRWSCETNADTWDNSTLVILLLLLCWNSEWWALDFWHCWCTFGASLIDLNDLWGQSLIGHWCFSQLHCLLHVFLRLVNANLQCSFLLSEHQLLLLFTLLPVAAS